MNELTPFPVLSPSIFLFLHPFLQSLPPSLIPPSSFESPSSIPSTFPLSLPFSFPLSLPPSLPRSSEFLPQEYAAVKGMEEKILAEQQQQLKGYSRRQAQDSYIFTACALPTYNTIFFLCMVSKKFSGHSGWSVKNFLDTA